jgi:hypothetical protein
VETVPDSAVTVTQGLMVVKSITAYDLQSKTLLGHQVQSVLCALVFLPLHRQIEARPCPIAYN